MANVKARLQHFILIQLYTLCLISSGVAHALTPSTPQLSDEIPQKRNTPVEHWLYNAQKGFQYSPLKHLTQATQLYQRTRNQPLWFDRHELNQAGHALVQAIKESAVDQPDQYPYHVDHILYRLQSLQTQDSEIAHLDIMLTDAFLTYAEDALNGTLIPNTNEPDHPTLLKTAMAKSISPFESLQSHSHTNITEDLELFEDSLDSKNLHELITQTLTPKHPGYLKLREAMDHYFQLSQTGEWSTLEFERPLKIGDNHPLIPAIKERLALLGDKPTLAFTHIPSNDFLTTPSRDFNTPLNKPFAAINPSNQRFDQHLADSLKHFQQRHGLVVNGILDADTQTELNVTPDQRIKQIAINMKRWRYLPNELGERYIMTNMADYTLSVIDQQKTTLTMDIIVGRQSRRTPILVQNIKTLVLNPTWSIPPRIASSVYLPTAKKNPSYLAAQNIEIVRGTGRKRKVIDPNSLDWKHINIQRFPYRLEQKSGKNNSLGEVKYPLNNEFAIYLHDTSKPELFDRSMRALSSGCIRVSKPRRLTEELLKYNPGWDGTRIARAHKRKKTMYVGLKKETPVYLMYWTAWVDEQGTLQFRKDIYGRDTLTKDSATITM